ncbi:hypothetical protein VTI74DRAFT_5714 [Chaetomium olivicolor]
MKVVLAGCRRLSPEIRRRDASAGALSAVSDLRVAPPWLHRFAELLSSEWFEKDPVDSGIGHIIHANDSVCEKRGVCKEGQPGRYMINRWLDELQEFFTFRRAPRREKKTLKIYSCCPTFQPEPSRHAFPKLKGGRAPKVAVEQSPPPTDCGPQTSSPVPFPVRLLSSDESLNYPSPAQLIIPSSSFFLFLPSITLLFSKGFVFSRLNRRQAPGRGLYLRRYPSSDP